MVQTTAEEQDRTEDRSDADLDMTEFSSGGTPCFCFVTA